MNGKWFLRAIATPTRGTLLRALLVAIAFASGFYLLSGAPLSIGERLVAAAAVGIAGVGAFALGYIACFSRMLDVFVILGAARRLREEYEEDA